MLVIPYDALVLVLSILAQKASRSSPGAPEGAAVL